MFAHAKSLSRFVRVKMKCGRTASVFGDIRGAVVGAIGLGIVESLCAAYISVPYKDAFAFIVFFAFLMVRPQGLFGEKIAEKA